MNNITKAIPLTVSFPTPSAAWDEIKNSNKSVQRFEQRNVLIKDAFNQLSEAHKYKKTTLVQLALGMTFAIPGLLFNHVPLTICGVILVVVAVVKSIFFQPSLPQCRQNYMMAIAGAVHDFYTSFETRINLIQKKIAASEPIDFKEEIEKLRFLHYSEQMSYYLTQQLSTIYGEVAQYPEMLALKEFDRTISREIRIIANKIQYVETCLQAANSSSEVVPEEFHNLVKGELNNLIESYRARAASIQEDAKKILP